MTTRPSSSCAACPYLRSEVISTATEKGWKKLHCHVTKFSCTVNSYQTCVVCEAHVDVNVVVSFLSKLKLKLLFPLQWILSYSTLHSLLPLHTHRQCHACPIWREKLTPYGTGMALPVQWCLCVCRGRGDQFANRSYRP